MLTKDKFPSGDVAVGKVRAIGTIRDRVLIAEDELAMLSNGSESEIRSEENKLKFKTC